MTIVGFNFSKIQAEHGKSAKGDVKIGTNVRIEDLQSTSLAFGNERSALRAVFSYTVSYDPAIGSIRLEGDVLFMQEKKIIEAILKEWTEKKAMSKKLSAVLVNTIMQKCTIQSLIMARDINLPPPMPLPKVKSQVAKPSQGGVAEQKPAEKPKKK